VPVVRSVTGSRAYDESRGSLPWHAKPSTGDVRHDDTGTCTVLAHDTPATVGWVVHKSALVDELVRHLAEALETARAAYAAAIEGATHPEAKAENDKDTRGLEQSYIARGQAQRVAELEGAIADLGRLGLRQFASQDPIATSALVTVDEDGTQRRYFIAPHGGGTVLSGSVQVITLASPVGRALTGKRVGDVVELVAGGKTRELEIVALE
jgi:transcription elongation GreA/GreB family factor